MIQESKATRRISIFCESLFFAFFLSTNGCSSESGGVTSRATEKNLPAGEAVAGPGSGKGTQDRTAVGRYGELEMEIPPADVRVPGLEEELDRFRAMQVKPEDFGYKPAEEGIDTGVVIFFGHILPPPYKLEYDEQEGTLTVNGIEVCPGERLWELNRKFFEKVRTPEERAVVDKFSREWREKMRLLGEKLEPIGKAWAEVFEKELRKRGMEPYKQYYETIDWTKVKEAAEEAARIIQEDERVKKVYVTGKMFSIVTNDPMLVFRGQVQKYLYDPEQFKKPVPPEVWKKVEEEQRIAKLRNQRWDCMMMYTHWKQELGLRDVLFVLGAGGTNYKWQTASKILKILANTDLNVHQKKILLDNACKGLAPLMGHEARLVLMSAQ